MIRLSGIIAVFFCAVLAGCVGAPKENFYVLSAGAPSSLRVSTDPTVEINPNLASLQVHAECDSENDC